MLVSAAHVVAVAELLEEARLPLVVDPVMIASSGDSLLDANAITIYVERLLPLATVMTPNLPEARTLLRSRDVEPEDAARQLAERFGSAVLLTGGHHASDGKSVDLLCMNGEVHRYEDDWIDISSSHGTGCTVSAALTAALAKGQSLPEAAATAKRFVTQALRNAMRWPARDGKDDLVALDQGIAE
jgi:hydroxymethylpyrimidine/phosphomethylpyrimidine kinase